MSHILRIKIGVSSQNNIVNRNVFSKWYTLARCPCFQHGECIEDLTLQDLHAGLVEDDRLQFDAFANAIATGLDREWIQKSTLGTWILMEGCNHSARTDTRVDVEALRLRLYHT